MFHIAELISSHSVGDYGQAHTHTLSIPINCIWIRTVEQLSFWASIVDIAQGGNSQGLPLKLKHALLENPQFSSMSFLDIPSGYLT